MITEKYCNEILQQYPEYITKDQMYRICHISKKTCLFLLESGLVPNIDSGKKTRRFKIKTVDVIQYLKDRDDYPELFKAPDGFYKGKGGDKKAPSFDEVFIDSGKIFVDNNDVTGWRESQRTLFWKDHASFIYQDYGIIDDETVSFNVSLKKFGNNQGQIKEVLEIVGLQGREKDKALVLSGGEKQRLGIARAILKNASVIFADEPTASLDNSNRQLVVSLLKDCANRGAAIILATHDERLVAECDTVVRLGT